MHLSQWYLHAKNFSRQASKANKQKGIIYIPFLGMPFGCTPLFPLSYRC